MSFCCHLRDKNSEWKLIVRPIPLESFELNEVRPKGLKEM